MTSILARKTYLKALLLGKIPPLPSDAELYCHLREHDSPMFSGYMLYYHSRINGYRWELGDWCGLKVGLSNKYTLLAYHRPKS